jgi:hypothetical protein
VKQKTFAFMLALALVGCSGKPNVTPGPALNAVKDAEVVKALDTVRDVAALLAQGAQPVISPHDALVVVKAHDQIVTLIDNSPTSWKDAALAALKQLQADLPPASYARLIIYLDVAQELILAYVPGGTDAD